MATDVGFGKRANISWRFKKLDGTDGAVDGTPTVEVSTGNVESVAQQGDGSWLAVISGGSGAGTVSVTADVDVGPEVKSVPFALAELNWLPDGQVESVSDVVVTVG